MDDQQFQQLLNHLQLSWPGYRKVRKGAKKRIGRHMRDLGSNSMQLYLEQLTKDSEAKKQCELLMSVSISRFFRDRKLWQVIEEQILPALIEKCGGSLKAWSVGCACGEEVYTLKIIWEQIRLTFRNLPKLEITATDLNPLVLERARNGKYPRSSIREVTEDLMALYFYTKKGGKQFKIKDMLKSGIKWIEQDFFTDPPGSGFHLIFVRNNLLTYYQDKRVKPVLSKIVKSLDMGGYLVIGSHEKLPFQISNLQPLASVPYVFIKATQ